MLKSIVITGISGFVGMNLHDYLKDIYDLNGLSVRYRPHQKFHIEANAIIHLAGKAHDLKNVSSPSDYYEANFELTKQLYDAFLKSNATVFIFMSTVKSVADNVEGVLTEEIIPNPKTHYGVAKHKAEEYILSKKTPHKKRVYIVRPCMIHGVGNKGNLNLLYQLVSKSFPWPLGAFNNQRSYLSIENLCFVINELLKNELIPSGIYQVADDTPLSTNDLISLIGDSLGKKSRIINVPKTIISSIAQLGDYLNLPLNSERLQKLTESYIVDNEKIVKAMGRGLPISTKDGLMKTFMSFRK